MAYRTATFDGVASYEGRRVASGTKRGVLRALIRHFFLAIAAVATVGLTGATAIVASGWFLGTAVVTNPYAAIPARSGPGRLALADPAATGALQTNFETAWARTSGTAQYMAHGRPLIVEVPESQPVIAATPAAAPEPAQIVSLDAPAVSPASLPMLRSILPAPSLARAPIEPPAAKVANAPPMTVPSMGATPDRHGLTQEAHNKEPAIADADIRTAVYDIAAKTVYLPNGSRLEAHSGLGERMDDPRHIKLRMRGPTPPNVYDLTLREKLFHGVQAIRLNPVDRDRMYGRDGMLAHTYMLGPNGQSNGCVSFKNYDKFLQAFLKGEVDRLVVVGELGNMSWRTAARQAGPRPGPPRRYAAFSERVEAPKSERSFWTW